jgi:hypothetical protein
MCSLSYQAHDDKACLKPQFLSSMALIQVITSGALESGSKMYPSSNAAIMIPDQQ